MKARISWVEDSTKRTIVPGEVYKPDTLFKGFSFGLIVILMPDGLYAKVEAVTNPGQKLLDEYQPDKLPIMEGLRVVGELDFK